MCLISFTESSASGIRSNSCRKLDCLNQSLDISSWVWRNQKYDTRTWLPFSGPPTWKSSVYCCSPMYWIHSGDLLVRPSKFSSSIHREEFLLTSGTYSVPIVVQQQLPMLTGTSAVLEKSAQYGFRYFICFILSVPLGTIIRWMLDHAPLRSLHLILFSILLACLFGLSVYFI